MTTIDKPSNTMMPSRTIWMCMTRRCNLSCTYCYQGSHAIVPQGLSHFMPMDIARKAVEWSNEWAKGPLSVIWYGGEPLLSFKSIMKDLTPHWKSTRKAAGLPQITHSVTTNGTLLTDEIREWADAEGMGILLSLDGPQRFHDKSRPYYDKHSSWNDIKPEGVLKWRPNIEIAWQLDPKNFDPATGAEQITPAVLDEMMALGFRNIAFNINWMDEWNETARWNLQWFFKHVTILMLKRQKAFDNGDPNASKVGLGCNWYGKLKRALTVDQKMSQPCGTGVNMVGISPEGWLYPSQEMVYTAAMPGRAPGTLEYYRLGDLNKSPVLDVPKALELAEIKTSQMKPPAPFDCSTCVAHSASIGGCHCRYIGDYQAGLDVTNRYEVTPGYCQSTVAVHAGMLMGASVERYIRPTDWDGKSYTGPMQAFSGKAKHVLMAPSPGKVPTMEEMTRSMNALIDRMNKMENKNGS